jgi:hypothetical protein
MKKKITRGMKSTKEAMTAPPSPLSFVEEFVAQQHIAIVLKFFSTRLLQMTPSARWPRECWLNLQTRRHYYHFALDWV